MADCTVCSSDDNSSLAWEGPSKVVGILRLIRALCRQPFPSEVAIAAIEARPNSPQWLQEEVAKTKKGLMRLRQNVVLLRNSDEPDSFFPVKLCCPKYNDLHPNDTAQLCAA